MGGPPGGGCTPTHKQGVRASLGRTPAIIIPGCFAKACRYIKATTYGQPCASYQQHVTLGGIRYSMYSTQLPQRLGALLCRIKPYPSPGNLNPTIHVNTSLSAHRRTQSDGNTFSDKQIGNTVTCTPCAKENACAWRCAIATIPPCSGWPT